jgi:hypothetical protein
MRAGDVARRRGVGRAGRAGRTLFFASMSAPRSNSSVTTNA